MEWIVPLLSIIMINLLLSGDNALVIALASRSLPRKQQKMAIFWGGAGAVGLRIILTLFAIILLQISYLQLAGGLLLLLVAIKLVSGDHDNHEIKAASNLGGAIKTILLADFVMSLDNVIAIAGVAKGHTGLLIIGLLISIPIIMWGSRLIMVLMEKWPVIITIGAAFLGWTAGEMVVGDRKIAAMVVGTDWVHWFIPSIFAILVVIIGKLIQRKHSKQDNPSS